MSAILQNANPIIYNISKEKVIIDNFNYDDEELREEVSSVEIFELIRHINDPEHPLTLEQLNVVSMDNIIVNDKENIIFVQFTPTIPHCSMATLIGLCLRVKLIRSLPSRFKVTIKISPGSHQSEIAINKQLADKERVAAALENNHLLDVVNKCITNTDK
jgi:metal-sulfur cluster biosynthetic enzyme